MPPSTVSVAQLVPGVVLVKLPAPVRFTAPAPPSVAEALSGRFTFSDPMFNTPALLSVPPLSVTLASVSATLPFRLSAPPLTYRAPIASPPAPPLSVVTAVPLFTNAPATILLAIVVTAAPEKLTVPVPMIGAAPLSRFVPPPKFSVPLAPVLKLPVCV